MDIVILPDTLCNQLALFHSQGDWLVGNVAQNLTFLLYVHGDLEGRVYYPVPPQNLT